MTNLSAIAHIVGAIVALGASGLVFLLIGEWEMKKIRKQVAEEASMALGVPIEDLDDPKYAPQLLKLSVEKFSPELFKNRFSDLCGTIRTLWVWLANIVQLGYLAIVVWFTITESNDSAVYAWFVLGIYLFFLSVVIVFNYFCKLLTGRWPGEAKAARKAAAAWVETHRELFQASTR